MKDTILTLLKSKRVWVVAVSFAASYAAKHFHFNVSPDVQDQIVNWIVGSGGVIVIVTKLLDENKKNG